MKSNRFFSTSLIVFLFCFALPHAVMAQEELIEIAKKISPSTVVVVAYDKEGKIINQGNGFFISEKGDVIIIYLKALTALKSKLRMGKHTLSHILWQKTKKQVLSALQWIFLPKKFTPYQ